MEEVVVTKTQEVDSLISRLEAPLGISFFLSLSKPQS